jgi:hypothetical protein
MDGPPQKDSPWPYRSTSNDRYKPPSGVDDFVEVSDDLIDSGRDPSRRTRPARNMHQKGNGRLTGGSEELASWE